MKKPLKVLVPTDLPPSASAVDFALGLLDHVEAKFLLLHVVPSGEVETFATLGGEADDLIARKIREASMALAREAERCRQANPGVAIETEVVAGVPFREICRVTEEEGCDMIVIATHGRTGVPHLLLGSTAERVVQHAPCPVLTFKPQSSGAKRHNLQVQKDLDITDLLG